MGSPVQFPPSSWALRPMGPDAVALPVGSPAAPLDNAATAIAPLRLPFQQHWFDTHKLCGLVFTCIVTSAVRLTRTSDGELPNVYRQARGP